MKKRTTTRQPTRTALLRQLQRIVRQSRGKVTAFNGVITVTR